MLCKIILRFRLKEQQLHKRSSVQADGKSSRGKQKLTWYGGSSETCRHFCPHSIGQSRSLHWAQSKGLGKYTMPTVPGGRTMKSQGKKQGPGRGVELGPKFNLPQSYLEYGARVTPRVHIWFCWVPLSQTLHVLSKTVLPFVWFLVSRLKLCFQPLKNLIFFF